MYDRRRFLRGRAGGRAGGEAEKSISQFTFRTDAEGDFFISLYIPLLLCKITMLQLPREVSRKTNVAVLKGLTSCVRCLFFCRLPRRVHTRSSDRTPLDHSPGPPLLLLLLLVFSTFCAHDLDECECSRSQRVMFRTHPVTNPAATLLPARFLVFFARAFVK